METTIVAVLPQAVMVIGVVVKAVAGFADTYPIGVNWYVVDWLSDIAVAESGTEDPTLLNVLGDPGVDALRS